METIGSTFKILFILFYLSEVFAWFWIIGIAFGDEFWKGLACFVPLFALIFGVRHYNLSNHPNSCTKIPLLIWLVGMVGALTSFMVAF